MQAPRKCWYCGNAVMENKGDYYQCRMCGATWVDVPVLSPSIGIVEESGGPFGHKKLKPVKQAGRIIAGLTAAQSKHKREFDHPLGHK